ncbi:hypothetical protein BDD12DRAFT_865414 [Trichophaea hybrida]|nr:hypothetical protein BDD12DRAFT_865414 [Trichophaea hybrida]
MMAVISMAMAMAMANGRHEVDLKTVGDTESTPRRKEHGVNPKTIGDTESTQDDRGHRVNPGAVLEVDIRGFGGEGAGSEMIHTL